MAKVTKQTKENQDEAHDALMDAIDTFPDYDQDAIVLFNKIVEKAAGLLGTHTREKLKVLAKRSERDLKEFIVFDCTANAGWDNIYQQRRNDPEHPDNIYKNKRKELMNGADDVLVMIRPHTSQQDAARILRKVATMIENMTEYQYSSDRPYYDNTIDESPLKLVK